MSLARRLNAALIDPAIVTAWARELAQRIASAATPIHIILFGSAADGRFREGSDLDILLVFADIAALRDGRQKIRKLGPLCTHCPVDLVFMTLEHFHRLKDIGGIAYIAHHEGISL